MPVFCIGNLTAGGAGKTPVALSILHRLIERGRMAQALSRGYGGRMKGPLLVDIDRDDAGDVGDEPLLLARTAPCWISADRPAGARAAAAAGADVIVMDDGFQNPSLEKDLSLLVVDGPTGFGNGRLLPAGPLREPPERGIARADALIILGDDRHGLEDRWSHRLPVLSGTLQPKNGDRWRDRRVIAFAGIGRPQKFFSTLAATGARILERYSFADHHPYTANDVALLIDAADRLGATLVTTEKDGLRLPDRLLARTELFPVTVKWAEPAALDRLIEMGLAGKGNGGQNGEKAQ